MNRGFFYRALTLSLTRLVALSLGFVDMVMLGHQSNYAVHNYTIASQVIQIFVILSVVLSVGINIVISESQKEIAERVGNIVQYSLSLACVLFALSLFAVLLVLDDVKICLSYLVLSLSILPLCLYIGFANILETIGLPKQVLYITLLSSLLNMLMNYWLIFSFVDDALAVSVSTLIVRGAAMCSAIIYLKRHGFGVAPIYAKQVNYRLFKLGRSEALTSILFTGGISLLVLRVAQLHSVDSTAYLGFALNFMNTLGVVFVGIAVSISISLAQEKQAINKSLKLIAESIIYIVVLSFVLVYCSSWLAIGYTNVSNTDLVLYLELAVFVIAFDGVAGVFISALRVCGHSQIPPFFRLALIFLGIPMSFFVEIHGDPVANIIIFMIIGNLLSMILCLLYFATVWVSRSSKQVITG